MFRFLVGSLVVALALSVGLAAPVPKDAKPRVEDKNTNTHVTAYRDKLKIEATSEWAQWPVAHAFDGKEETSWYSNGGDAPQNGKTPTVTVTFPENVKIKRVTILGNRDPQYPTGYFVLEGKIELLDKDGKVLDAHEMKGEGEKHDFDLILKKFTTVRAVRFTMTKDEGRSGCVGLGEFQVE